MRWDIAPKVRCDIITFSGINCAGLRAIASIHPLGGLQGSNLDGISFQSMVIVGRPGTRVTLITTVSETDWEQRPWRVVEITKEHAFRTKEGKWAVRIPHLDCFDAPNAHRTDPDFEASYNQVQTPEEGTGWTFGRSGSPGLCNNIRAIKVEKRPR